jgi:hypothetical protein
LEEKMGQTLMGQRESGTPMETQQGASDLARMFQMFMQDPTGSSMGRMANQSMMNMLGFDPSAVGMNEAATAALTDPRDSVSGLFSAMRPFEERQTAESVAGLRDMFGSMGGRVSRGAADVESIMRGELGAQFGQNRQQALLEASGQRNQALASLLAASNQAQQGAWAPIDIMSRFMQPQAPMEREGLLPGLLSAGGNLAALWMMSQGGRGG